MPGVELFPPLLGKSGSVPDSHSPVIHPSSLKGKEKTTLPTAGSSQPPTAIPPVIQ